MNLIREKRTEEEVAIWSLDNGQGTRITLTDEVTKFLEGAYGMGIQDALEELRNPKGFQKVTHKNSYLSMLSKTKGEDNVMSNHGKHSEEPTIPEFLEWVKGKAIVLTPDQIRIAKSFLYFNRMLF